MLDLTTRRDLTLAAYERVAWDGEPVRLTEAATRVMRRCRASFLDMLDHDPELVVYGVTTRAGEGAKIRVDRSANTSHHANFRAGVLWGPSYPERVLRGFVLARLANYLDGHAAVRPELALAVAEMLDGGPLPEVGMRGEGGPGEILPLGQLFESVGRRLSLQEKEGMALVNGSPCSAALVADAALVARRRWELAARVFALSIEAFRAPLEPYADVVDPLWGDPDESVALEALRRLLHGAGTERRAYQAPVSYRIVPRVLGAARRALAATERSASISLAAVTDNPVYIPPDEAHPYGQALSTGGYQNTSATPALDGLGGAWADLVTLAQRHITNLLDGDISLLPHRLLSEAADAWSVSAVAYTVPAVVEEAVAAATRTPLPQTRMFDQNDVSVPTFLAWEKEAVAGSCLSTALAILAATASQALLVTSRPAPPALEPLVDEVRAHFPAGDGPAHPGRAVEDLAAAFQRSLLPA